MQHLSFIRAKDRHIQAIIDIHNSNILDRNHPSDRGFLLAKTSEAEILNNLAASHQYFIAVDTREKILGFLAVSKPKISAEFLSQLVWKDESCKDNILSDRHLYIQVVATKSNHTGQGIAKFMYNSLQERFPDSCFSAFIVAQPFFNKR